MRSIRCGHGVVRGAARAGKKPEVGRTNGANAQPFDVAVREQQVATVEMIVQLGFRLFGFRQTAVAMPICILRAATTESAP